MNPPEGMPGSARTGGSHRLFYLLSISIRYGGMVAREGERREILRCAQDFGSGLTPAKRLNFESRPVVFMVIASFTREV